MGTGLPQKGEVIDTLYVATAAPNLPVELLQHGTADGHVFAATDPYYDLGGNTSLWRRPPRPFRSR